MCRRAKQETTGAEHELPLSLPHDPATRAHAIARELEERAVVKRLEAEETRRLGGRGRADGERQEAGDARGEAASQQGRLGNLASDLGRNLLRPATHHQLRSAVRHQRLQQPVLPLPRRARLCAKGEL